MLRLPRIAASRALLVAYVLLLSTIICSYFLFTEARISGFSVIQENLPVHRSAREIPIQISSPATSPPRGHHG
ncbi:hypothetical protein POTOM_041661 [Populus tomentosa]|uniref:Uncharacterized protein n=1 Tax=Populus tomentosa TaxID=118781 RepID=A0A8X8CGP1_POPTO|nr:hypothetical protein POTOM_041661 [Populus tomentosa]